MALESEFLRPEFVFEREFGQFRNWWTRDTRIVGNAFSILMYLVSHRSTFRLTQSKVQKDLELGRDAFLAARRRLEAAGFLMMHERRFPAGSVDADGRSIAGHRLVTFELLDPVPPAALRRHDREGASADNPPRPDSESESASAAAPFEASADSPRRLSESEEIVESGDEASADNPAPGYPLLKEDHVKENQPSSSDAQPGGGAAAAARPPSDDDDDVGGGGWVIPITAVGVMLELHPRLHASLLVDRLRRSGMAQTVIAGIDLELAAVEIMTASARPVGDPVAYVAKSLLAEPWRWAYGLDASPPEASSGSVPRPLTAAECAERGHRWMGQWNEFCGCGAERPGWRDDRDGIESVEDVA